MQKRSFFLDAVATQLKRISKRYENLSLRQIFNFLFTKSCTQSNKVGPRIVNTSIDRLNMFF